MLPLKTPGVLPGFKLSLGLTVLCLSLLVVLPFAMMAAKAAEIGWDGFRNTIAEPNVLAAVRLSLRMSFYAMLTNVVFGTLVAWVLVRYEFPGKGLANALVDLPFALPTAVTGIALAALYAPNGWIGRFFEPLGIKIAFTPVGIWIALVVVSLPFIVRAVQPVLEELSGEYEEAAATLGANRFTTFRRVLLPEITPALLTGAGMMFARATGGIRFGDFYRGQHSDDFRNPAADYYGQAGTIRRAGRVGGGVVYAAGFVCDSVCAERDAVGVGQAFGCEGLRSSENESAPQNTEFVGRILVSDKHLRFSNLVGFKNPTDES